MLEICTQSIISANHKSKANSHHCILESVLFVKQLYLFWIEMSKLKNHHPNAFSGERKRKLNDIYIIMSNCTNFDLILFIYHKKARY